MFDKSNPSVSAYVLYLQKKIKCCLQHPRDVMKLKLWLFNLFRTNYCNKASGFTSFQLYSVGDIRKPFPLHPVEKRNIKFMQLLFLFCPPTALLLRVFLRENESLHLCRTALGCSPSACFLFIKVLLFFKKKKIVIPFILRNAFIGWGCKIWSERNHGIPGSWHSVFLVWCFF